jgi:hypothetical protein
MKGREGVMAEQGKPNAFQNGSTVEKPKSVKGRITAGKLPGSRK